MIIRIRYKKLGGHIHCRVFIATAKNMTWQKSGDLVFDEAKQWDIFRNMMNGIIEFMPEDQIENLTGHYLGDV